MTIRYETRAKLLSAAASVMASRFYLESRLPGPNDDAEEEYNDHHLLVMAREYVEAHKEIITQETSR